MNHETQYVDDDYVQRQIRKGPCPTCGEPHSPRAIPGTCLEGRVSVEYVPPADGLVRIEWAGEQFDVSPTKADRAIRRLNAKLVTPPVESVGSPGEGLVRVEVDGRILDVTPETAAVWEKEYGARIVPVDKVGQDKAVSR